MPRDGSETKANVLDEATQLASLVGLNGLTIGGLAGTSGVSKGAVANHFPSKERLQVETIAAAERAMAPVFEAAAAAEPGMPRLRAMLDAWLDYLENPPFAGGCFFCVTSLELGGTTGAAREAVASVVETGLADLLEQIRLAQRLGELADEPEPEQLLFEIHAVLQQANWARRLFADDQAVERARTAIDHRLNQEEGQ